MHCALRNGMSFSIWTYLVWWRWSTRWVSKQRLDGSYKVSLWHEGLNKRSVRMHFFAGTPKLTTSRGLLTIAVIHGNPAVFGDCRLIDNQCRVGQNQCICAMEAQLDSSRYGFARKLFKDARFLLRPGVFTAHRKLTT